MRVSCEKASRLRGKLVGARRPKKLETRKTTNLSYKSKYDYNPFSDGNLPKKLLNLAFLFVFILSEKLLRAIRGAKFIILQTTCPKVLLYTHDCTTNYKFRVEFTKFFLLLFFFNFFLKCGCRGRGRNVGVREEEKKGLKGLAQLDESKTWIQLPIHLGWILLYGCSQHQQPAHPFSTSYSRESETIL